VKNRNTHWLYSVVFFLISYLFPNLVFAAQSASTLPVSTVVTTNCSLSSTLLNFGNYDPIVANVNVPLDGVTTFQIACTKGAIVTITLNNGMYSGNATVTTRAMSDGNGHYLSYELYSDPSRSSIWNLANTIGYNPTSSAPLSKTVYGRIPAGQNQAAGNYIDTVIISAVF
jgi:spore coat protein U-like protein